MQVKDEVHQALLTFIDFIYAIVFALIVQQSFDEIMDVKGSDIWPKIEHELSHLFLLMAIFYFLAWDWILGRILTLRNPLKSYSRFFLELLIAVFAYGTANAAIKGKLSFLVYLSAVLLLGGFWARRTERQLMYKFDLQELCIIQVLQFSCSGLILSVYLWWHFIVRTGISVGLVAFIFGGLWLFIFIYEIAVPRYKGLIAGPGVPFFNRPLVRKIRKRLLA
jgi:hypothetical protein